MTNTILTGNPPKKKAADIRADKFWEEKQMNKRPYQDAVGCIWQLRQDLWKFPALIYPLDRNQAAIVVVGSNLLREKLFPSGKAFAHKMKLEAISKQVQRNDLTFLSH